MWMVPETNGNWHASKVQKLRKKNAVPEKYNRGYAAQVF